MCRFLIYVLHWHQLFIYCSINWLLHRWLTVQMWDLGISWWWRLKSS